ncbi:MAG: hypothetical protein J6Y63_01435 [Bacteroidales bacterium]|jgi:Skp family chaperone for outer membrane proteins|nr:hypothetical protein [Bacteroidales bacterium]
MNKLFKWFVVGAMLLVGAFTSNAQGFGGQMPSADEIAKMRADQMKETVSLTDDQYAKVTVIFKEEMEAMQKMFEGGGGMGGDFEQMRKDMEKRQEEQNKKLKEILTEDQFNKWQKQQEEMRAQFGGGGF